nr:MULTISPECIES: glucoamylase family protein [unclassified Mesorhizobium]
MHDHTIIVTERPPCFGRIDEIDDRADPLFLDTEGPRPSTLKLNGIERSFEDYVARGVPYGPDDGTLAPWAVVASLPFAPEIVRPAISFCIHQAKLKAANAYGFKAAFNPTHPGTMDNAFGWWVSPWHFGLNEGPVVLMERSQWPPVAADALVPVHPQRPATGGI